MTDQELIKRLRAKKQKGNRFDSLEYEAADRIEELMKERDDYAHKLMASNNTYTEMHVEIERLSNKLAKAVAGLKPLVQICELMRDGSGFRKGRYQHEVTDSQWAAWCKQIKTTRATVAELEGK